MGKGKAEGGVGIAGAMHMRHAEFIADDLCIIVCSSSGEFPERWIGGQRIPQEYPGRDQQDEEQRASARQDAFHDVFPASLHFLPA